MHFGFRAPGPKPYKTRRGFTLVEILTTVVIVGVLATAAIPIGQLMIIRQQESALKQSLSEVRKALDRFFVDYKTYPASFRELRGDAPPNFNVCYMREAPPLNPFTGDQYDWAVVTTGTTEYNKEGCYETDCSAFMAHNAAVFQNEQSSNGALVSCGVPGCKGYWGIWDIRYPREDRLAINETLYKDW